MKEFTKDVSCHGTSSSDLEKVASLYVYIKHTYLYMVF